jgi:hypothetical protein
MGPDDPSLPVIVSTTVATAHEVLRVLLEVFSIISPLNLERN